MKTKTTLQQQLFKHLNQQSCSFSIGCFGAIAEFHRLPSDHPQVQNRQNTLESLTPEGAIRIRCDQPLTPVAYEMTSRQPHRWQQGVVFCLPAAQAVMSQRQTIAELGEDSQALQQQHRTHRLFDLGIGAKNIDFCIRTDDAALIEALRACIGQSFFAVDVSIRDEILRLSPDRVIVSKAGRIEVYQPIGKDKTPEGSHTHLLPKLLATGRTHSANVPVPDGYLPVLHMYPESSLAEDSEGNITLNQSAFEHFQALLKQWGGTAYLEEKARVKQAILANENPEDYPMASERHVRTAVRVTIRQLYYLQSAQDNLTRWNRFFNPAMSG